MIFSRKIDTKKLLIGVLALIVVTIVTFIYASGYDDSLIELVKTKYKGTGQPDFKPPIITGEDNSVTDARPVEDVIENESESAGKVGSYPGGFPNDDGSLEDAGNEFDSGSKNTGGDTDGSKLKITKLSDFSTDDKIVLFPKTFPAKDLDLPYIYKRLDGVRLMDNPQIVRYSNADLKTSKKSDALQFTNLEQEAFHKHPFSTFTSYKDIDNNKDRCNEVENTFEVEITSKKSLDGDIEAIVRRFINEKSAVYEEVEPFFRGEIEKQFAENRISKHWYRLAGTSVWLEQYGVHYMISRLIYSPKGTKNQPVFSLTYVQLYNENWEELTDTELVVPTNDPDSIHKQLNFDGTFFTSIRYPSFIPVPAFHDPARTHMRYYGPEDPRILLTKNANGHEEPLVIYNAYHKKISADQLIDEGHSSLSFKYYRSMFMCFPWQFQRGKRNIYELPNEHSDKMIYSRAIELRRSGMARLDIQKNWTPLIDFSDRKQYNHDKYVYFVYRWSDLEVLKCQLDGIVGSTSNCEFAYRMNDQLGGGSPVGALRGGTEMININSYIQDYNLESKISIPDNKEVFIGFARAHLKNCGCGNDIYRPNLVVIVKDLTTNQYKIDTISSFVSLDVPMLGWDLDNPDEICSGGPSVFIPNGISAWSVREKENGEGYDDYMTLSFSITDATVDIIHIKGLLKAVMDRTKYIASGYNNDNVECALDGSDKFCHALGEEEERKKHQNRFI